MSKATAIARELEALRKKHGGALAAEVVVEFAKNKKTALHSRFCWDDTDAAHRYRLWQARDIIASVRFTPSDTKDLNVRAYVSLTPDRRGGTGYRAVVDVMSNSEQQQQMMADALADLTAIRRKYKALDVLIGLDVTIAELRKAMRGAKAA